MLNMLYDSCTFSSSNFSPDGVRAGLAEVECIVLVW